MRRLLLLLAALVMCASSAKAQTNTGYYFDIASLAGTWILKQGGLPRQGYFIVDGAHINTFNPCNSSDFIPVSFKDLTPNPDPCRSAGVGPPKVHPHPIPYGVLNSKPFDSPTYTVDTQALNGVFIAADHNKAKQLLSKVNSGKITTIYDLKNDPTFANLVKKKSTITPL